jgi:hypothetical protein
MMRALLASTALALVALTPARGQAADAGKPVASVQFTSTPAPASELQMLVPYTGSSAVITYVDGTKETVPLAYKILSRSGDFVGGWYAGLIVDKDGKPVMRSAPNAKGAVAQGPFKSAGPDASSLLMLPGAKAEGAKGNVLYLVNHFEYDTEAQDVDPTKPPVDLYGTLPMAMNVTVLDQDPATGDLKAIRIDNVDFAKVGGLWIPCNG